MLKNIWNSKWQLVLVATLQLAGLSVAQAASVLADAKGMTVYIFDNDQGTTSSCYGTCEAHWPPVLSLGIQDDGLGLTTRKDGTQQVTYDGKPIYYFAGDQNPGDANGDGLGGVWHVIKE